jgi:hypothetical protein
MKRTTFGALAAAAIAASAGCGGKTSDLIRDNAWGNATGARLTNAVVLEIQWRAFRTRIGVFLFSHGFSEPKDEWSRLQETDE